MRELRTARLILSPFRTDHRDDLHALWNDPQVRRYLWDDQAVSCDAVLEHIELSIRSFRERGYGHFTISTSEHATRTIGFTGLRYHTESDEVELYYALLPSYWGSGFATEAAGAVLRFGFEEAELCEIVAAADLPNSASFKVMERLGMTFLREGQPRNNPLKFYGMSRKSYIAGIAGAAEAGSSR